MSHAKLKQSTKQRNNLGKLNKDSSIPIARGRYPNTNQQQPRLCHELFAAAKIPPDGHRFDHPHEQLAAQFNKDTEG